ncbi:MAG: hypothetical protein ABI557_04120 [Aureliella sp.]
MPKQRKTILVEKQVQGALGWRIAAHWFIFLGLNVSVTCSLQMLCNFDQDNFWSRLEAAIMGQVGPVVVLLALLPWFVHDSLKLSNRFAGPMVRLQKSIVELTNHNETPPVVLRSGDFWQEIASNFNELRMRVLAEREQFAQGKTPLESEIVAQNSPELIISASNIPLITSVVLDATPVSLVNSTIA